MSDRLLWHGAQSYNCHPVAPRQLPLCIHTPHRTGLVVSADMLGQTPNTDNHVAYLGSRLSESTTEETSVPEGPPLESLGPEEEPVDAHDTEGHDTEGHDTEGHDTEAHDTEAHDTEAHDTEGHDTEAQDT
ncbi:hypothetical protein EJ05DRAFT_496111 [Pseudovirgaria hyperparasitica]|uniref:Uncharacterized protein n=1 Tax=Pseudovirgaria hyperparasitica TaxID=470096 RepID=A0A6A6WM55_9PEZI|nr:uncharacterized protein EJ05DRAFT_496111 [Pseudovirgaria hyperparasitica]KAF2763285.1 hypothetical protein EJ05DRAFT_496111 [Pseudovirgaria hyperparasitica]